MHPPTLADKEALKLRLQQQFGMEKMPFYIEQAQKQFTEPNPPDWIFLYKFVAPGHVTRFIHADVWEADTPRGVVHACEIWDIYYKVVWETMPTKDTPLAIKAEGCLMPEDSLLLIQLAQRPTPRNIGIRKDYFTKIINDCPGVWNDIAILRRQPSQTRYIQNNTFLMFQYRELERALSETLKKMVDRVSVEITVGDVV